MSPTGTPGVEAASQLRQALEQTASALAEARLGDLLAAGEALEVALTRIPRSRSGSVEDAERLRAEIDAARAALLRCRRLGVSLSDFVRATFDAHGAAAGYDPSRQAAMSLAGRGVNATG